MLKLLEISDGLLTRAIKNNNSSGMHVVKWTLSIINVNRKQIRVIRKNLMDHMVRNK